jgi:3-methyladenine DNA glycosylase/8-oxoguanine DNA glycosylase
LLSPARLASLGLSANRATTLTRLCREVDLERLRETPGEEPIARLQARRGIGPWSLGVIALQGLGRYDHGLVGDLGLVKICSALQGRPASERDTVEVLRPYDEWQGLASVYLLAGFSRGLIPGASPDLARAARRRRTPASLLQD